MDIKLLFLGFCITFTQSIYAGNKITGGFGIKFGDHYTEDYKNIVTGFGSKMGVFYSIVAPKPYRSFTRYMVKTNQGKINYIRGEGNEYSLDNCILNLDQITKTIIAKYGLAEKSFRSRHRRLSYISSYKNKDKSILIVASCKDFIGQTIIALEYFQK